jgi:hypothetical protein
VKIIQSGGDFSVESDPHAQFIEAEHEPLGRHRASGLVINVRFKGQ